MSGHLHGIEHAAALDTPVHRVDARVKIVVLLGAVLVVVSTPPGAWAAFAAYAAVLLALVAAARLPPGYVLARMVIEVPFLASAALLVVVRGWTEGLTLAARVTLSVLCALLLSSTTPFPQLLRGFAALRVPQAIITIVALLWRYLQVLGDELRRMRIAREARAYRPRTLWAARRATGATIGALFVRALERGERVHLAMLSRGYTGALPPAATAAQHLRPTDLAFATVTLAILLTARGVLA